MALRVLATALCLLVLAVGQKQINEPEYVPPNGFVPDEKTALKIAEAVLIPIYGEEQIESERPLHAALKDDVWTVETTSPCEAAKKAKPGTICYGGGAVVKLSKTGGRILFATQYK